METSFKPENSNMSNPGKKSSAIIAFRNDLDSYIKRIVQETQNKHENLTAYQLINNPISVYLFRNLVINTIDNAAVGLDLKRFN